MKLTLGMAVYNEFESAWFTVQALRAYHDLKDAEILVVDNKGDDRLQSWVSTWGRPTVRYERATETTGTSYPRHMVFELARGEFVICMDSHVLLMPGALENLPVDSPNLIQGPMVYDNFGSVTTHMEPVWRDNMWGVWADAVQELPATPFEIPMHGLGLFGCRKDAWLGFNSRFKGFGGEEGYIHEKFRQAGHKTICVPWFKWVHLFRQGTIPYPISGKDRIRNYVIGFDELGLDKNPLEEHFGEDIIRRIEYEVNRENTAGR